MMLAGVPLTSGGKLVDFRLECDYQADVVLTGKSNWSGCDCGPSPGEVDIDREMLTGVDACQLLSPPNDN